MIVAGMGCTSRASPEELRAILEQVAQRRVIDRLACPEARADQFAPLARAMGVPLLALPRAAVKGISTPTDSARSRAAYGTGCVSEACALVGAGPGARIVVARQVSGTGQATCALAEGDSP